MPVCLLYKASHDSLSVGAHHFRERGGVPNKLSCMRMYVFLIGWVKSKSLFSVGPWMQLTNEWSYLNTNSVFGRFHACCFHKAIFWTIQGYRLCITLKQTQSSSLFPWPVSEAPMWPYGIFLLCYNRPRETFMDMNHKRDRVDNVLQYRYLALFWP